MPTNFVKVELGTNYLIEVAPGAFPSGSGFFSFTSSQYFAPQFPLGWWVYQGSLEDTSSGVFFEGVVVPGQGGITKTTGSLIHTGSTLVIGTASVSELKWDGYGASSGTLTSFSSSTSIRITTIEENPSSFWTASGQLVSRFSDVEITGSLIVSGTEGHISASSISASTYYGDGSNLTGITGGGGEGLWTASNGDISRFSDVLISGSLLVSSSISGTELNWDGSTETLTSFSSSTSIRLTTNESNSSSISIENLPIIISGSLNDVYLPPIQIADSTLTFSGIEYQIRTGSIYVEMEVSRSNGQFVYATGSISDQSGSWAKLVAISSSTSKRDSIIMNLTGSSTNADGLSLNVIFSRSIASGGSGGSGGSQWTASGTGISRFSDVLITGSLIVSGTEGHISASSISASTYYGDGGNLTGISAGAGLWTASGDFIRRQSDIEITGSLSISATITASAYLGFEESLPILISGSFNDTQIPPIYVPTSMSFVEVQFALETGSCFIHVEISGSTSGSLATGSITTQSPWGTINRISESVNRSAALVLKTTESLSTEHLSINLIFKRAV